MSSREAQLESELKAVRLENQLLREKVDLLVKHLYGSKSEKLDPKQLILLEQEASKKDTAPAAEVKNEAGAFKRSKPRSKSKGPRIPDHLPVREEVLEPEAVKEAPEQWRCIGEEVSEQLDYEPARFLKRRLIRPKYVRKGQPYLPPVIATLPECLQERCLATPELIAQVIVSKYADHVPLYRQELIYKRRHGVYIPRQTLCRWLSLAADSLQLLYQTMHRQHLEQPVYLQVDETPVAYLEPGRGKTAQGYLWVSRQPGGGDVIYRWHPSRSAACLDSVLGEDFKGTVQCDGYQAYSNYQKQRAGPIELAGCWAHARRKFYEAKERSPQIVGFILKQIAHLYRTESALRKSKAGPRLRAAMRASQSAPLLQRIKRTLMRLKPRYLPQSNLGKAIAYTLGQWPKLEVFASNGHIEIDNNGVENAIRPTAVGKKNWLFIGSEGSGQTSAILYTLVESAKAHGLEPYAYLCELLRELPKTTNWNISRYTPRAIAQRHNKATAPLAA